MRGGGRGMGEVVEHLPGFKPLYCQEKKKKIDRKETDSVLVGQRIIKS
jgi:hypothetical protein